MCFCESPFPSFAGLRWMTCPSRFYPHSGGRLMCRPVHGGVRLGWALLSGTRTAGPQASPESSSKALPESPVSRRRDHPKPNTHFLRFMVMLLAPIRHPFRSRRGRPKRTSYPLLLHAVPLALRDVRAALLVRQDKPGGSFRRVGDDGRCRTKVRALAFANTRTRC